MRGVPDRPRRPRGETARIAARVEALMREYRVVGDARPDDAGAERGGSVDTKSGGLPVATVSSAEWLDEPMEWDGAADRAASNPTSEAVTAWPWDSAPRSRPALPGPADEPGGSHDPDADAEHGPASMVGAPRHRAEVGPPVDNRGSPTVWQRLVGRIPVRLDPGRRSAIAVGVAVLVAAAVAGVWLASTRPQALPVTARTGTPAAPSGSGSLGARFAPTSIPRSSAGAVVVVDVAGKVRHPGLYRLPSGARVDDAIRAAGGARPGVDLTGLNLAARVVDGEQIAVGAPGAAGGGPGNAVGSSAASGPVDLNTATSEQLQTLPGVGPVTAQHIIDYRTQHGGFRTVDQLRDVSGIGEVRFAALRALVTA